MVQVDVVLQSISKWLSKMANGVMSYTWASYHVVRFGAHSHIHVLVCSGVVLDSPFAMTLRHLLLRHAICHLPFWTTILKSTVSTRMQEMPTHKEVECYPIGIRITCTAYGSFDHSCCSTFLVVKLQHSATLHSTGWSVHTH